MGSTQVTAWNIRWGGQDRTERIAATLSARASDVIVLSEYQPAGSASLLDTLHRRGWVHQVVTSPPERKGGLAVLSRTDLTQEPTPSALAPFGWRYLPVLIPALDLEIVGLYGPLHGDAYGTFWPAALDALEARSSRNVLVIGDFNTAESSVDTPVADFFCSNFFCDLSNRGYTDLWRHRVGREAREYSWLGPANPYRLDHAFGTRGVVDRVTNCVYSHVERESGISDHSLLTVELATS